MTLIIARVATDTDISVCLDIRRQVFVVEQGVPEDLEVDGLDAEAVHLLARHEGEPAGTLRLRRVDDAVKIERVAVLPKHRGAQIGSALTRAALEEARLWGGITRAKLGAQVPVIPFYEALGFVAHGPVFDDAGIPHRTMECAV